mmetsp:Transcript_27971/g.42294  ORF Transcript_27971/g.42294 Transcript_27971/m.42294 type:complete len:228 (+) Transcript_27971:96-779(+)
MSLALLGIASVIIFPAWVWMKIKQITSSSEEGTQEKYPESLSVLFEEFELTSKPKALYQAFFLLRRLILVTILIFLRHQVFFQCLIISHLSILNLVYLTYFRPFESHSQNRIEIFNEFTVFLSSMTINSFLNGGVELTFREFTGWMLIGISCLNIIVNLLLLGGQTLSDLVGHLHSKWTGHQESMRIQEVFSNWKVFKLKFPQVSKDDFREIKGEFRMREFCREWSS